MNQTFTNAVPAMWRTLVRRSGGFARRALGEEGFSKLQRFLRTTPADKVVMFHIGRSGSTVLGDLLRQHHQVYWDGEILSGHAKEADERKTMDGQPWMTRWRRSQHYPDRPYQFLEARFPVVGFRRYYGMEMKFFHLSHNGIPLDGFIEYLRQNRFKKFIVLQRNNFLRKVVSSLIGSRKGAYHAPSGSATRPDKIAVDVNCVRIDGDAKPLLQYFDDWSENFARLRGLLQTDSSLELTFEDDIEAAPTIAYRKCCDHLSIPPCEPVIKYSRTNPFPISDLVENFSALQRELSNTPYEWMLESAQKSGADPTPCSISTAGSKSS